MGYRGFSPGRKNQVCFSYQLLFSIPKKSTSKSKQSILLPWKRLCLSLEPRGFIRPALFSSWPSIQVTWVLSSVLMAGTDLSEQG